MRILLMAAAAVSLLAGAAVAQPAPPPPHEMGEHGMMAGMGGHHHPDPARMADHIRSALQLRPDQEPALQALVASMKPPADMAGKHDKMMKEHEAMASRPTPEKLDFMIARAKDHIAKLEAHAAAVKTFYAALSPAQQKAFDTLAMGHMRHMHHMMGHPSMGPMGPMGGHGEE